jgi:hypothetical protein
MPRICVRKLRELDDSDLRLLQEMVSGLADETIAVTPKVCFRRTTFRSRILSESAAIRLESDLLRVVAAKVKARACRRQSTETPFQKSTAGWLPETHFAGQRRLSGVPATNLRIACAVPLSSLAIVRPTTLPRS